MKALLIAVAVVALHVPDGGAETAGLLMFGDRDHKHFLGCLTCSSIDPDSVCNSIGKYGSEIAVDSIWNEIGNYGSPISERLTIYLAFGAMGEPNKTAPLRIDVESPKGDKKTMPIIAMSFKADGYADFHAAIPFDASSEGWLAASFYWADQQQFDYRTVLQVRKSGEVISPKQTRH